jgi:RES domain-containing protein
VLTGVALDNAIRQLISRPLRHTFFRAMPLRHAGDPLGKRRPIVAQRFNLAGGARVLYLAEDQVTSLHEIQAFGWPPTATAVVPVQFDLKAVIDLRDPNVQTTLQTSSAEIALNFRSLAAGPAPTQVLGERCCISGQIDGLLFESPAMPRKANLAVFEAALILLRSSIAVNDPNNNLFDSLP